MEIDGDGNGDGDDKRGRKYHPFNWLMEKILKYMYFVPNQRTLPNKYVILVAHNSWMDDSDKVDMAGKESSIEWQKGNRYL